MKFANPEKKIVCDCFFETGICFDSQILGRTEMLALFRNRSHVNKNTASEKLKPEETRRYIEKAFEIGEIRETGTDIDKMMPAVSRFGGGGNARADKKAAVLEKLKALFEKYMGIGTAFKVNALVPDVYELESEKLLQVAETSHEYKTEQNV